MNNTLIYAIMEICVIGITIKLIGATIYNIKNRYGFIFSTVSVVLCTYGFVLTILFSSIEKERIPMSFLALATFLLYIFFAFGIIYSSWLMRLKRLGNDSVIDAFDRMDVGLCYYEDSGRVMLCNEYMHEFSQLLLGNRVLNGREFKIALEGKGLPVGESGAYEMSIDDRHFSIESRIISRRNKDLTEIKCTDNTDLYKKMEILVEEKEKLQNLNEHLRTYGKIADKVIREQEILNAKIRMHDRFGALLLKSMLILEKKLADTNSDIDSDIEKIVNYLRETIEYMNQEEEDRDYYEELLRTANSIGVTVNLSGEMPVEEEEKKIVCLAIRECITNTVRHAMGNNLYVNISNNEAGSIRVTMTNDGIKPKKEHALGTGLSSLKEKVEKTGGSMKISWLPEFELTILIKR